MTGDIKRTCVPNVTRSVRRRGLGTEMSESLVFSNGTIVGQINFNWVAEFCQPDSMSHTCGGQEVRSKFRRLRIMKVV